MEQAQTLETEDNILIQQYLAGDENAFSLLYARHKTLLYSYLERLLFYDRSRADDLFQQTWIRALDNLSRYRDQQQFSAWLLRIAHNLVIDHFRKGNNSRKYEGGSLDDEDLHFEAAGKNTEPWRDMHREELEKAIGEAVENLDADLKEVFLLRQEDIPFKEIARIQRCSVNTVLGRMQYALKNLRKQLAGWKS